MRVMKKRKRLTVWLILIGLVASLFAGFGGAAVARADDKPKDYSLYNLASNASSYFSYQVSPENNGLGNDGWLGTGGIHENWEPIISDPASAGSLLGYSDPEFSLLDVTGWFESKVSGQSQSVSYKALENINQGNKQNSKKDFSGVAAYAHYGAALKDLGLDVTKPNFVIPMIRGFTGILTLLFYTLAVGATMLMMLVVKVLKLLNVFGWFYEGVAKYNTEDAVLNRDMADGMVGSTVGNGEVFLYGLRTWVGSWYGALSSLSWTVIVPAFIAIALVGLLLFKPGSPGKSRGAIIKKLVVRILFIGLGLPLIGGMYSATLNQLDGSFSGGSGGPTKVILNTFVDFESWMNNERLKVPDGATIGWDSNSASASGPSQMAVRGTAEAINIESSEKFSGLTARTSMSTSIKDSWKVGLDGSNAIAKNKIGQTDSVPTGGAYNMLIRFLFTTTITPASYESGVKEAIGSSGIDRGDVKKWFVEGDYKDAKNFGQRPADDIRNVVSIDPMPVDHPVIAVKEGSGLKSAQNDGVSTFTSNGVEADCGYKVVDNKGPAACNLSPLAAYNFLTTSFDSKSMTTYSSMKSGSQNALELHTSVAMVGSGFSRVLFWCNALATLGCMVVLAFSYALGMLVRSVKRMIGLVGAIPFSMLGSLKSISKVVIYTIMLILEVLGTVYLYQFASELLVSIPDLVSSPMSSLLESIGLTNVPVLNGLLLALMTLISTVVLIAVTLGLLRARKQVLQALDEAVTKIIDSFVETQNVPAAQEVGKPGGLGSTLGGLGKGLAGGAAMAAGSAMVGRAVDKLGDHDGPKESASGTVTPKDEGKDKPDPKAIESDKNSDQIEGGDSDQNANKPDGDKPDGGGDGGSNSSEPNRTKVQKAADEVMAAGSLSNPSKPKKPSGNGPKDGQKPRSGTHGKARDENRPSSSAGGTNAKQSKRVLPTGVPARQVPLRTGSDGSAQDQPVPEGNRQAKHQRTPERKVSPAPQQSAPRRADGQNRQPSQAKQPNWAPPKQPNWAPPKHNMWRPDTPSGSPKRVSRRRQK